MIEAIANHADYTQEIKRFEQLYQPQQSEITVIIRDKSGFSRFQGQKLWSAKQEFVAYLDKNGNFIDKEGSLNWLVEGYKPDNVEINFADREGVYTVKVRQHYPANFDEWKDLLAIGWEIPDLSSTFMLVDIVNKTENAKLQQALVEYKEPIIIYDNQLGKMIFDNDLDEFNGKLLFLNKEIYFSVKADKDYKSKVPTADKSIAYFKDFLDRSSQWNQKLRQFATDELIENAMNWQAGKGNTITKNDFYNRIQMDSISIYNDGSFTAVFLDDDIFWGHIIIVSGHLDGTLEDVSIAG